MTFFRNVVFLAAAVGLFAGISLAVLQTFATVPLILQAETYEGAGASTHDHGTAAEPAAPAGDTHAVQTAGHDHDEGGWAPEDGFERTAFTALANIVTATGFALLLVAASELAGGIASWRAGMIWGFAGFAVFTLAPSLGLPPELPTMPAADLLARQAWWITTVVATAAGLAMIVFRGSPGVAAVGLALILAPHIIGAPQPVSHESMIPADLHHRFVVAVTMTNLVFWVVLGAVTGWLRPRFLEAPRALHTRVA